MVNPSFSGRSSLPIRIRRLVEDPENEENPTFVVDLVDQAGERVTPLALQFEEGRSVSVADKVTGVSITAFAEELEVWGDERKYGSSQRRKDPKFASTSLIPIGLFANATGRAQPYMFMTGIVREFEERKNSLTGAPFVWSLVETHGGSFDVLSTPDQVRRRFGVGSVIQGQFWLIGRVKGE